MLNLKWDIYRTPLPKAERPAQESGRKNYKSLRSRRTGVKQCLLNTARWLHSELIEAVVGWTSQVSQHSSIEWEGVHKPPLLPEKLETFDSFWGRESLSFVMIGMEGQPYFNK